jgi:hypothetical protein
MIKIILFLVVIIIIYLIYQNKKLEPFEGNNEGNKSNNNEGNNDKCNLDIDNLYIYDRDKTYNKYINKVIDNNNNINYTKEEIEIMKNKHQFYNLDDKKNISNLVLGECKNSYGYGDGYGDGYGGGYGGRGDGYGGDGGRGGDGRGDGDVDKISTYDIGGGSYYGYNSNVTGGFNSDINEMKGYGDVKGDMIDKDSDKGTCDHNLDNYYYDLSGNNIKSTLQQYRKDDNKSNNDGCVPITYTNENIKDTVKSSMIIPDTYNINKDLTNAYDVNWSKVLNPLTIY